MRPGMGNPRRRHPLDGLAIQIAQQHLAEPGVFHYVAQGGHPLLLGMHAGRARMPPVGDVYLPDRLGAPGQLLPDAQALEQPAAAMGQGGGSVVVAGLPAPLNRRLGLDQANGPARLAGTVLQRQCQTGPDHAPADNIQAVAHAGTLAAVRAAAISASISSASRGTLPVRIWCPSRVTSTSSSIRMPIPRHLAATCWLSGAMYIPGSTVITMPGSSTRHSPPTRYSPTSCTSMPSQ